MGAIAMAAPLGTQIRERILESAAALMEERSFFDISLADIARAARISKGTLYYYYNSRDAILFDLTDRYLQKLSDDLLAWVDNEKRIPPCPACCAIHFPAEYTTKAAACVFF
jgi:AcrR family transcriptional regulator